MREIVRVTYWPDKGWSGGLTRCITLFERCIPYTVIGMQVWPNGAYKTWQVDIDP